MHYDFACVFAAICCSGVCPQLSEDSTSLSFSLNSPPPAEMASNMPPPPPVLLGAWARRSAAKEPAAYQAEELLLPTPDGIPMDVVNRILAGEVFGKDAMRRLTDRVMAERRGLIPEPEMLPLAVRLDIERVLMERNMPR